jgi:hypothetical protein
MQFFNKAVELVHQIPEFILAGVLDAGGQIAFARSHVPQGTDDLLQAAGDRSTDNQAQCNQDNQGDHHNCHGDGGGFAAGRRGVVDGLGQAALHGITHLVEIRAQARQALGVGGCFLAYATEIGSALDNRGGDASGGAVVAVQFGFQRFYVALLARVKLGNAVKILDDLGELLSGSRDLLIVACGHGAVDLVFDELQQTPVDGGEFQGRIELVAHLTQSFRVVSFRDDGKGLAHYESHHGYNHQQREFV